MGRLSCPRLTPPRSPIHPFTIHHDSIPPHRPHRLIAASAPYHLYESRRFWVIKRVQPTAFGTSSPGPDSPLPPPLPPSPSPSPVTGRLSSVTNRLCGSSALSTPRITSPAGVTNLAFGRISYSAFGLYRRSASYSMWQQRRLASTHNNQMTLHNEVACRCRSTSTTTPHQLNNPTMAAASHISTMATAGRDRPPQ